jgi:hypothetical protein
MAVAVQKKTTDGEQHPRPTAYKTKQKHKIPSNLL